MKTNTVYKRAYNRCLALLASRAPGDALGSENQLAQALNVSRTTVRAVLEALLAAGLAGVDARGKILARLPEHADYFPGIETESVGAALEKKFMAWVLQGDCRPGQVVYALELARQFDVSTSAIREHLNRFSQFGLIKRRQNGGWVFGGFTEAFAIELSEVREMFELRSAQKLIELDAKSPVWGQLDALERQHHALMHEIDARYRDFSALDEQLHRLINDVARNRFIENFYTIISLIFHYHYQWNKTDEKARNFAAIQEHLAYISALKSRNPEAVMITCSAHMRTSRVTLLKSIERIEAGLPLASHAA
jgi:DNA-binding GntR family transcriptional regulator